MCLPEVEEVISPVGSALLLRGRLEVGGSDGSGDCVRDGAGTPELFVLA